MRSALILLVLATTIAHAGPSDDLNKARLAFRQKDCSSAMKDLTFVLYPEEKLADRNEVYEARAMLGACYVDTGDRERAKDEFAKAIQIKPREPLDPLTYSEGARRLYDDTKADIENRAKKDEEIRKLQQQREDIAQRLKNLRLYKVTPYSVNFLPFGLNARETGSNLKFALFGAGQVITLGTSAGIWYYLVNKYGIRSDKVPVDDATTVFRLQGVEIAAGIAFFVLYGWSVVDSLRHYEPQKRVQGADELLLKELEIPTKPQPKKTSIRDAKLIPVLTSEGGLGIGLGWEMN